MEGAHSRIFGKNWGQKRLFEALLSAKEPMN
jgi:hypothetical protein